MRDFSFERITIDRQPIGHRHNLRELEIAQGELTRFWFIFDRDLVTGFHVIGSDIDVPSIDLDVTVGYELTRPIARVGQAEPIDHVVEPRFEKLEQDFAGDAAPGKRGLEIAAELAFEQSVLVAELLLRL